MVIPMMKHHKECLCDECMTEIDRKLRHSNRRIRKNNCVICGVDIHLRLPFAKYCKSCAREKKKEHSRVYCKKRWARLKEEKENGTKRRTKKTKQ